MYKCIYVASLFIWRLDMSVSGPLPAFKFIVKFTITIKLLAPDAVI